MASEGQRRGEGAGSTITQGVSGRSRPILSFSRDTLRRPGRWASGLAPVDLWKQRRIVGLQRNMHGGAGTFAAVPTMGIRPRSRAKPFIPRCVCTHRRAARAS